MSSPDEEISLKVSSKLKTDDRWNDATVNRISDWVKTGNCTVTDLVFLLESQKVKTDEGPKE
ncbi:hypothetical protein [Leptospira ilyithenensis]|uniref:Uncharacterized protein n=1 Tax=Leptospira ilyithenensis TaxID=2484901 RepID=A0A4R9LS30_9LEPT|nr:hypothetical protein [Leptospira ilyithenensis]TGN11569.1 hypothetical protein EHS11_06640 [Leptospira ilyithenensis]